MKLIGWGLGAPSCRGRRVHFSQRACQVLDQIREGPLYRASPRDQLIIIPFQGVSRSGETHRLLETPARPVADHGATEAFRRGEAKSRERRRVARMGQAAPRLKNERGRGKARSALHEKEFGPGLETSDGRHWVGLMGGLSRQAFAPLGSAAGNHLTATLGGHPRAKTMAPFADEPRWLISAFQGLYSCPPSASFRV